MGGPSWTAPCAAQVVASVALPLLSTDPSAERSLLASAAALDIALQGCPSALLPHTRQLMGTLAQRLALMRRGGGPVPEEAAAVIPSAIAARAYLLLLGRATIAAPSAVRQLVGDDAQLAASLISVWAALPALRSLEELAPMGRGPPSATGPCAAVEERHLAAHALCLLLRDAAALVASNGSGGGGGFDASGALPNGGGGGPLSHAPPVSAAVLRSLGCVTCLVLQALGDLRAFGDEPSARTLPLPEWEPAEGLPNAVDAAAQQLSAADAVRAVPLRALAAEALGAARAAMGDDATAQLLRAEERLRASTVPWRRTLLQGLFPGITVALAMPA